MCVFSKESPKIYNNLEKGKSYRDREIFKCLHPECLICGALSPPNSKLRHRFNQTFSRRRYRTHPVDRSKVSKKIASNLFHHQQWNYSWGYNLRGFGNYSLLITIKTSHKGFHFEIYCCWHNWSSNYNLSCRAIIKSGHFSSKNTAKKASSFVAPHTQNFSPPSNNSHRRKKVSIISQTSFFFAESSAVREFNVLEWPSQKKIIHNFNTIR